MSKIFKCISLVLVLVMMLSMTTFAASISTPAADASSSLAAFTQAAEAANAPTDDPETIAYDNATHDAILEIFKNKN